MPHQLQQALLKVVIVLPLIAHELCDRALALSYLAQTEGAQLVQLPAPQRRGVFEFPAHGGRYLHTRQCDRDGEAKGLQRRMQRRRSQLRSTCGPSTHMTAGMEGKTRQASRSSLLGVTVATICMMTASLSGRSHRLFHKQSVLAARSATLHCTEQQAVQHRHHRGRCSRLLSKLLNEDEAANEDVGIRYVLLELLIILPVPELLQQIADHLKAHLQHATVGKDASLTTDMLKKESNRIHTLDHGKTCKL